MSVRLVEIYTLECRNTKGTLEREIVIHRYTNTLGTQDMYLILMIVGYYRLILILGIDVG